MDELKIIKYLDGEMSSAEKRAFEEEIRMNPALAEELERYRHIQDLAEKLIGDEDNIKDPAVEKEISEAVSEFKSHPESFDKVSDEYRATLEASQKNYFDKRESFDSEGPVESTNTAPIKVIRGIWFRAAAIIVLAIILSILIFKPFSGRTPEELYAKYMQPFQKTEKLMEIARNDNDFLFAVEVFEAGDFDRSIVLFEMLADSSELRAWSLFYAGSSYMSINRSVKAIELFKEVLLEGDAAVLPHAHWQLALSYIRTGNPDKAREHLEILAKDKVYRSEAKRIMRIVY